MMSFAALTSVPLSEYMIVDEVEFNTQDIFNKYGFADGDLLQDLYYEYMQINKSVDFKEPSNSGLYGSHPRG